MLLAFPIVVALEKYHRKKVQKENKFRLELLRKMPPEGNTHLAVGPLVLPTRTSAVDGSAVDISSINVTLSGIQNCYSTVAQAPSTRPSTKSYDEALRRGP